MKTLFAFILGFTLLPLTALAQSSPVAETNTPDIQALARNLQNDPVRIFNYVHDHIRFVLYFGSKKGAELTLLEKSGNDFDQSALLAALLRAAGYSPTYEFSVMEIPYDQANHNDVQHWLQLSLNNTVWTNTVSYLQNLFGTRGYPFLVNYGDGTNVGWQRVWVQVTIGGTNYNLDPAFKVSEPIAGTANLAQAFGFNAAALLSAAGGTDAGNYVTNLNEAGVRSTLATYTTNFLNFVQTNSPNASVAQILSGHYIVAATNTSLPPLLFTPDTVNFTPLYWTYEPTNLMSTLGINFAGTNYFWFMPQLLGQRLSLTYSINGLAQLWQDDTLLAQSTNSGTGGANNVILSVNHPFGSWNFTNNTLIDTGVDDNVVTNTYQNTNSYYNLFYAFEPDWGWLTERQNKLDTYRQNGLPDTSRQVTCETLNVMGLDWLLQTESAENLFAAQMNVLPQYHNRLGRMAQEAGKGTYVDAYLERSGAYSSAGSDATSLDGLSRFLSLTSYFNSAMEHGIIEQSQATNLAAASAVKMLEIAATNNQAVYLAYYTNWNAISGSLQNYGTALGTILTNYILQGYYVLLPQNGSNHLSGAGSWAGYGYAAVPSLIPGPVGMIISGGYHGGYPAFPAAANADQVAATGDAQPDIFGPIPFGTPQTSAGDPVDTADGTFQVSHTDLSLGQDEPRGISLTRYYNGLRRNSNPAGMAGGWLHNYYANAITTTAEQPALGGTTPAQAAALIVASASAIGLYNDLNPDPKNWTVTALVAKWAVDQVTKAGVTVNLGKDVLQFVKQPSGVFTPPANSTMTLTQSSSAYSLLLRHGNTFNFDTNGRLATIVDQYGNSLSVSYLNSTSSLPYQVTDWKNRQLTFSYAGGQLTAVSDGTRTVQYGYTSAYNTNGDLATFTDAEGKATTYAYDTNHQVTATIDAMNRLVISNIYDSQGHVATQYTEGLTNKTWNIYWTGWQNVFQDPAGGQQTYFYDDLTRLVAAEDALGHTTRMFYDGQNHTTNTVSPLGETNQFFFDGNNNVTSSVDPLGFASQYIYDSLNNLIETVDPLGHSNTFGYNVQFSVIGQTNGAGDWINYGYNTDGTLATRTDVAGMTTYGYDSTYRQLTSITWPNGLGTNLFVNNAYGDVVTNIDARGFATVFTYNNRRQLTKSTAPTNLVGSLAYDPVGNAATNTDALGNVTTNYWSATRHLLATSLPATSQGEPVTTNIYDNREWLVQSLDPLQKPTSYTNDLAGRLLSMAAPVNLTNWFTYDNDGRKLTTANAAAETNSLAWDARGQMVKQTDGAGHFILSSNNAAGNQVILTNRNGNKWQFQFDAANRLIGTTTPMSRSNVIVFNHQGLPTLLVDQASQNTTNSFDARARLVTRGDKVAVTANAYDGNNNLLSVGENGNTNAWTYDAYSRVSSYRDIYGNLIQYRYDANGNLTNLVYPGNKNVYYTFNSLNQLVGVTDWSGRITTFLYDLDGRLISVSRPNGTYRTASYNAAGEVTNIWEQMANGLPIAWFRLNWTNSGNVAWEFAAPLPHTNSPPARMMAYDADNRLMAVNGTSVSNDPDGNLTFGPLTLGSSTTGTFTNFAYDARNRLLSAAGVTNAYDAINNRIGQVVGTNSTVYVVNPNAKSPQVLMRIKNGVTNYYVYGAGLLYQITETASGTNTLTYHYDNRGSTVALSGDNGLVTDRVEYSLYGLTTYRTGTNDTPFLFNGRYGVQTDPNGLLYMRARYYNPYICRFINPDPSGFRGGLNFYVYANGNPVSLLDAAGLSASATGDNFQSWVTFNTGATADLLDPFGLNMSSIGNTETGTIFDIAPVNPTANNIGLLDPMQSMELAAMGLDYNPYMDQPNEPSSPALMLMGVPGLWEAAGLPTMNVAVGEGGLSLSPIHVAYGVGDTWVNAVGSSLGDMTVSTFYAAQTAETAYFTITGIPILNPVAVTATGGPAWTCVTAAISAFFRAWLP